MAGNFEQTIVRCTDKDRDVTADILHKSDYTLKVALVGTQISIHLKRSDLKKPYVGSIHNMEFTSTGDVI